MNYISTRGTAPVLNFEDTMLTGLARDGGLYLPETIPTLTEAEIAAGMAFAFFEHNLVLEGAGAVGIAALLHHKVAPLGQPVAVVLSGGNVDMRSFLELVQGERGY